ncbi:hypothetical protein Trydic_g2943 [Trypoxylus dichotomus]
MISSRAEAEAEGKTPAIRGETRQSDFVNSQCSASCYSDMLKLKVLPHLPFCPDIASSDYHLLRSMAHGAVSAGQTTLMFLCRSQKLDTWIASKDEHFFRHRIRRLPKRWEEVVASNGQYFES